jgi:hypothetical protein
MYPNRNPGKERVSGNGNPVQIGQKHDNKNPQNEVTEISRYE